MIVCACCSWEMALNAGLDASFGNVGDLKECVWKNGKLMVGKLLKEMRSLPDKFPLSVLIAILSLSHPTGYSVIRKLFRP